MGKTTIPGGHILMARQINNSKIWLKRPLFLKCFLWIVINANHADREKKGYVYKRGELVTTYDEIIKAMSHYYNREHIIPTVKQIRVILKWLESEGMIKVHPIADNRTSELPNRGRPTVQTGAYIGIKIVVVNYDTYQTSENYKGIHKGRPTPRQGHNNNNEKNKKEIYVPSIDEETRIESFDKFYKAYPKHQGRKRAFDSWKKLNLHNGLFETILTAIENQKAEKKALKQCGGFVPEWPLPATWLNGKRWEDEITNGHEELFTQKEEFLSCPSCGRRIIVKSDLRENGCVYCLGKVGKTTEVKA